MRRKQHPYFQAETEEAFSTRYLEVTASCRAMLASGLSGEATTRGGSGMSHAEELVELLSRVTRLYMALLQLENFAVLNYCGLGKILVSGGFRSSACVSGDLCGAQGIEIWKFA